MGGVTGHDPTGLHLMDFRLFTQTNDCSLTGLENLSDVSQFLGSAATLHQLRELVVGEVTGHLCGMEWEH